MAETHWLLKTQWIIQWHLSDRYHPEEEKALQADGQEIGGCRTALHPCSRYPLLPE